MLRALTAVLGATVVAMAGGACASTSGEARGLPGRVDACDLLTRTEAEAALGGRVTAPTSTVDAGADALAGRSGCAWSSQDERAAALFELVRTGDMAPTVRRTGFSAWARFNAAATRHTDARPVDLGERAFWVDDDATLHVLVEGRSYLVVEVAVPTPLDAHDVARRLAQPAVARLASLDGQTEGEDE